MIQENSERLFNKLRYKNQQIKGDFAKETETIRKRTKKKKQPEAEQFNKRGEE